MMTATQPRKPRSKPARHAHISRPVNGNYALLLQVGTKSFHYWLEPFAADVGHGFLLTKWQQVEGEPGAYHVNLHGPKGHTCECAGFCRWNHCKHLKALLALIAQGRLQPLPSTAPQAAPSFDFDNF